MGRIDASEERLATARKALNQAWEEAAAVWADSVALDFEAQHIRPLVIQSERTSKQLSQMNDILTRVVAVLSGLD